MQRKYQYRRNLPHLQNRDCALFITFASWKRWILPEVARDLALESCLRVNGRKCTLYAAVIMPDHVHLILCPVPCGNEYFSIPEIMKTIKSESAHRINQVLSRTGRVWQDESFDHLLRRSESLDAKTDYIIENPVRAGLVRVPSEYRWIWRYAGGMVRSA